VFDPARVRATRSALGLSTEASQRFERGVDESGVERAVRRAVELILEVAGGKPASAADARVDRPAAAPVALRVARVARVLGMPLDESRVRALLEEIGFVPARTHAGTLTFGVPGHRRHDITREIDLIEEIARRHGYEEFPDALRPYRPGTVPDDVVAQLENALRLHAAARGFLESRGLPFVPAEHGEVRLLLPLSAAEDHLRAALVPGLLRRLEHNFARGTRDIRLFEIGTVFGAPVRPDELPLEATRIGFVFTGARSLPHWSGASEPYDAWDLKGLLEELAALLGGEAPVPLVDVPSWAAFPAFRVGAGERTVGWGGRVAAAAVDAPAWAGEIWAAELEIQPPERGSRVQFSALPSFPALERDLALVVPDAVAADRVEEVVRSSGGPLLESVVLFDLYRGSGVGAGARSLAYRLRFRAPDRTLTDREADRALERVLKALEELDVRRR
jgi:phenylalanyl-tRNA synthetase beta chain